MSFLSNQAMSPLNIHLLFVQPYYEVKTNAVFAFKGRGISNGRKIKHLITSLALAIPLINTVVLLILRTLLKTSSTQTLGKLLIDHLYNVHIYGKKSPDFTLFLEPNYSLSLKFKNSKYPLSDIIKQIDWTKLEKKWHLDDSQTIRKYLDHSLIFSQLKEAALFQESAPFIKLYTSYGMYSWLNPLLRTGTLRSGLLSYATNDANEQFKIKSKNIVDQIAKELLFISLATTVSLLSLPDRYEAKCKVIRMAQMPKNSLNELMQNDEILEKGFLSAAAPGGCFAGGGPCDGESVRVKFVIHSNKGLYVNEFSDLPENEVIFKPFTKFKVLKRSGSINSSMRFELEEKI